MKEARRIDDEDKRIDRLHLGVAMLIFAFGVLAIVEGQETSEGWKRTLGEIGIALSVAAAYAIIEMFMHIDLPTIFNTRFSKTSKSILDQIHMTSTEVLEEMEFMKDIHRTGVTRVLPSINAGTIFEGANSCRQIWMMFNTGSTFASYQLSTIVTGANCKIRILMADGLRQFWEDDDVLRGNGVISELREIILTLEKIKEIYQELCIANREAANAGNTVTADLRTIEIRKYRCAPQCSMFIFDNSHAWIIPYLPYQTGGNKPAWKVESRYGNLFKDYVDVYRNVWNHSDAIPLDHLDEEIRRLGETKEKRDSAKHGSDQVIAPAARTFAN